ncbi:hypothetical protein E2L00_07100 [Cedecea colo]|uniref:Transcriptional regulator n=1 Tax=Cedecea colo TaxID=2552946 RepID=A0ABX0VM76_9ENTR|nr:hypothetical protein [Cedecea colo]
MTIVMTILASDNARNRRRAKRAAQREAATTVTGCRDRVQQALRAPNWRESKEDTGSACLPQVALYSAGHRTVRKDVVHIVK